MRAAASAAVAQGIGRRCKFAAGRFRRNRKGLFVYRRERGLFLDRKVSLVRGWIGRERGSPALLRMSEKSFMVALLGSTPKERVKSFVARSIVKEVS